jgi:hypothetical protein
MRPVRAFVAAALTGIVIFIVSALNLALAGATTITEPSGSTIEVSLDAAKYAAPFTVKAEGFEPYENVFVEQCNGRPPIAEHWAPSVDCDFGSAPAAAVADADGRVTFAATDRNHAPFLFVGAGPQELFNCLPPKGAAPNNGLENYRNCQLRISSSNTAGTDDQVFLALKLPEGARAGIRTPPQAIVSGASTTAPSGANASGRNPSGSGSKAATSGELASSQSGSNSGSGSSSSFPYAAVLLPIAAVVIGGSFFLLHKRRSGRVAA